MQNIGAYGVELAQTINQVDIYDLNTQNYFSLNKDECEFAYRHSIFKRKPHWLITHVSFALAKQRKLEYSYADLAKELAQNNIHTPTALQISDAVMHVRKRKLPDPKIIGNVGSFFKNPIISTDQLNQLITHHPQLPNYLQSDDQYKIPAAWLIEQCGFKGQSFGGAAVSKEHALVLINAASAKGSDVLALATLIQEAVQTQFQITLQMEPVIIR